ncbi:hypothetical protein F511_38118 [Dorcoceras hygrometricum]|uniref:HECT-type E3 ubiquitin transferase n=1 Tax=Dorcoceras hygrometricum TaxID=472368 RepID=A0A2Z7D8Y4_9LAMI|nr:hypothetical protein F511_38118 [Dorcoceras hygrometricum]
MKLKRRRALEVPSKIKTFISNVTGAPPENIEDILKSFYWAFDKGDFHHWVDLFNYFDTYFEKYIKPRKDLQLEDNSLESDPPFPREAVLHILRVIRIILENCTNKHLYSSYEHHLSSLLSSTDPDVVEASLQTLAAFLKKSNAKYILRDASLRSRLFALAQGWGGKEEGLGLISCALQNGLDPIAFELGCSLHFQFYAASESANESTSSEHITRGLQVIHISAVDTMKESDLELLNKLVIQYKVPHHLRFSLLTRLRFARAFSSVVTRHQYTCIRLYAFIVLVQACSDTDDLVSYLNTEPEFINELVTLLSYEDAIPGKIRILCLLSLVALCQDRSRQPTILSVVTSGGHRGILSSLMLKAVDSVVNNPSKCSIVFAESLLSLITMLVSSSSGCSAMREAGFIPTLLPLLKDVNPQHLHLVSTAVHVLEAFMDYSNPAAALFRDLGGLDDTIARLMVEVSHVENGSKQHNISTDLDSDGFGFISRRLLMKALLRAISLGTYAPGTTNHLYGSEESLLPRCICIIFKRAKDFGGGVFSLAATVMSDLIHKDPTCFSVLDAAGLPSAFMDAIMDGVLCSAEAITCIPQCLDALCLNNNGLQAVKERNALRCFVKVFTSKTYLRALAADTLGSLSSGLDELMRHASSLRAEGVDMLIEILSNIAKIGSGIELASQSTYSLSSSEPVPMEIEYENRELPLVDVRDSHKPENGSSELILDASSMREESFLPECISNASRFLETVLQNSDTCRIFVEKKGIECVLQLFTLPLIPLSASLGQSITVAFKNFSPQHSTSLARALCIFLREHLKLTNELLTSIGGSQFVQVEISERVKILRCLSSLEGILYLCNSLLKGTATIVSELGSADADVFKDLGKAYREILWQVSLCCELKVEEKRNIGLEPVNADMGLSTSIGRENDDDANIPSIRYTSPAAIRNAPYSDWGVEREFIPMVRSSEGSSRRSRHSLARLRGSRIGRCLEAFQMDYEAGPNNAEISYCEMKQKSPEILIFENLNKLASTLRSFFTALVKGFTLPNRRRTETASLASAAKSVGTALAKIFLEALGFSGYSGSGGHDISLSVKCRYLGKVVADMVALTFDSRRRTCYNAMINNFYFHGTFKELLTTFVATSQLLWTPPYTVSVSGTDVAKIGEGGKPSQSSWLLDTLQGHCRELEYFVNSGLLLSSTSASHLLVQPVDVGLSLGLFPVPKDPEAFIYMLQSQVLDVIRPIWCHPLFPKCDPCFITSIISLMIHVCNGVSDVKRNRGGFSGTASQRLIPPPDEATIATIIEMGFSRARAEEALRRAETNSVEMAMEWLFNHAEDPVQEDDELARALALSLGSSSETPKIDSADKSVHVLTEVGLAKAPPADDILATAMKLFQGNDTVAFRLTDLFVTVCSRNSGKERLKVISYLVQQLKLCQIEFSKDSSPLGMISHTLALIISEDGRAREIAAQNGIVSIAINILMNFMCKKEASNGLLVPKCISALILILDNLSQTRPKLCGDANDGAQNGPSFDLTENQSSETKSKSISIVKDKNDSALDGSAFEDMLGKPTGYLMMEESSKALVIACDLIKKHVPPMVMQAALQLCARLTKSHILALQFLENGGMPALFGIPRNSFFPGYVTLASAIIRHLLEDPQTLQTAMELEIRQTLSGNRHVGGVSVRTFLTSMAPVISRNPEVFMKAAAAVCQLESLGGRSIIILAKDKEKEKSKASVVEAGVSTNECRIVESKTHDGFSKYSKGHKKVSANLMQVIDFLLEIVLTYPLLEEDGCAGHLNTMEVDETTTKKKGKLKVDETVNLGSDSLSDQLAALAKMTFVLKLLSDILLMYAHAGGVILKRDLEMSQLRVSGHIGSPAQGGVIHHILHRLLPLSVDKSFGSDEWRDNLSEKASWYLVVLAGRSSEGRRRNSSSGNLPGSGCSPDIAKSMIDGGIVLCLSDILQAIDLDHPDASKVVNLILKSLESLTRAANASEQVLKSDALNKKKIIPPSGRSDAQHDGTPASQELQTTEDGSEQHRAISNTGLEAYPQIIPHNDGNQTTNLNVSMEQEMRIEEIPNASPPMELGLDYMREEIEEEDPSLQQSGLIVQDPGQADESRLNNEASNSNGIDPTFLDALPEDLRAEVLASQQAQPAQALTPTYAPPTVEDIDPEFLAALPLDIQAEVLAQQRVQRIAQQSDGQPVDMDNASIIATFSADLREEVLLTSSEAVLSALPSPLLAEAQMLRDRALNRYHARSLFGNNQGLNSRGNRLGLGFDRRTVMDRGVGVTIGRGSSLVENLKLKELDGEPLLDAKGLKALIRLLRLAQPLGKGLLQRLLLNLCTHSETRAVLVRLLLDLINPETVGIASGVTAKNEHRLYGCQSDINGRSQLRDGVPPIVMRRVLEILTYMATNHSGIASLLFYFKASNIPESTNLSRTGGNDKGKDKIIGDEHNLSLSESSHNGDAPLILLLRLLSQPLCLRSIAHLEQVMGLLQVVVFAAAAKVEFKCSVAETAGQTESVPGNETESDIQIDPHVYEVKLDTLEQSSCGLNAKAIGQKSDTTHDIFVQIPRQDLHNLCSLLGHEGLSDKVYTMAGEVLKKLASVAVAHRKFFVLELSESAHRLSRSAVNELITLRDTHMLGLSSGSMAGAAVLRVLQILSAVTSVGNDLHEERVNDEVQEEHTTMSKLNVALESLWEELSECISAVESVLSQNSESPVSSINVGEHMQVSPASPPLPPGSQRLLPFIEGFFVLCEKIQSKNAILHQDNLNVTAREVKESAGSSVPSVPSNPALLEKSLCMMLKAPRLIDFDNKRAYFRSRIRQQHDQHLSGPLRISVRRAYILEDSYNQLRKRPSQDLKGRLNVHFQGEEGIDAGGLTREWYQLLSRVLFDKGALLFTTVGNNATFQPNPNSVYQTEHLSYFRFVGRVVAKALFDGQLLDVYFTRSFYKHILGVKVTYHDIEAVDPDYYKNLKWMLENDVSDIPDLTFSIDADEEKHILYEKTEVTDYELKPGGRNIRVTEETKHEYVDLVADHILTNAIRPQINSFLEGFNELVPRELISIFNDKELELLISGLPEIDLNDLKANTEYTGYTAASNVVQWFWDVVKRFNKEDMARLLQFVTGTSKVPLEGFKALQGISGPQRFQIHKAYGAPERLPSAHTCFNQLDLPEYTSKEQLQERMLLAIHEASEGFGFG